MQTKEILNKIKFYEGGAVCPLLIETEEFVVKDSIGEGELTNLKRFEIPFWEKMNMTIREAAAYSNIGINKIDELLKQPTCNFVLYVGNKKLVKRREFKQYISESLEI